MRKTAKDRQVADRMQTTLHTLLNRYLNGGFSTLGYLAFPLWQGTSRELKDIMIRLKDISLELPDAERPRGLLSSLSQRNCDPSEILREGYRALSSMREASGKGKRVDFLGRFDMADYPEEDQELLAPIAGLRSYADRCLRPFASAICVHGSYATEDYIPGWSDLDVFLVMSGRSLTTGGLKKARKAIYRARLFQHRMDPLQHHGLHIITEHDLRWYPESYMPIAVMKNMKLLAGTKKYLDIRVRGDKEERRDALGWWIGYFLRVSPEDLRDDYKLKFFLHGIALFPSLYLQWKGKSVYKRESFRLARPFFTKEEWWPIEEVGRLRARWRNKRDKRWLTGPLSFNPILAYQLNASFPLRDTLAEKNGIPVESLIRGMRKIIGKIEKQSERLI